MVRFYENIQLHLNNIQQTYKADNISDVIKQTKQNGGGLRVNVGTNVVYCNGESGPAYHSVYMHFFFLSNYHFSFYRAG